MKLKNGLHLNVTQVVCWFIITGITIVISFFLFSCSDSKLIERHLKKAEKHGGKIICDTTYIDVPKIVKGKDGKDSLIYVPIPIPCAPCQPCETLREIKWKYKYDLKRQKARDAFIIDSLNKIAKITKIEGNTGVKIKKQETKQIKSDNKTETKTAFPWEWLFAAIVAICLMLYLIFRKR
jgi:phosphate/sulfate permease